MSHRARKRFGQNFLHDKSVISEIIDCIQLNSDSHIVEIGPGTGALTEQLAGKCMKLTVIEIDRDLAAELEKKFSTVKQLQIYCQDALKFNFGTLPKDQGHIRIVGNLPYNISTPLLFHILDQNNCISDMHFMLQKEVVERICAKPGSKIYGRLSVMTQYKCHVEKLFDVAPECFTPKPRVISSMVRLTPHSPENLSADDYTQFESIVKHAFSQRRKTLKNSIKEFASKHTFASLCIDPNARPETLTVTDFVRISNYCSKPI